MSKNLPTLLMTASLLFAPLSTAYAQPMMPQSVQNEIIQLANGPTSGSSCVITSLFPAFYGQIPGAGGKVAVGLIDNDSENCGSAFVTTKVVAYSVDGSAYHQIALPAQLDTLQIQKILSVTPLDAGFKFTVLYRGPSDPMCCAKQQAVFSVKVTE